MSYTEDHDCDTNECLPPDEVVQRHESEDNLYNFRGDRTVHVYSPT